MPAPKKFGTLRVIVLYLFILITSNNSKIKIITRIFLVSKVDEKLKAAEARRAELQRAKAEEQERKYNLIWSYLICINFIYIRQEMRKSRLSSQISVMKSNDQLNTATQTQKVVNVRDFAYLKVSGKPKLFKLDWNATKREKSDEQKKRKLFTIAVVEKLIQVRN